MRHAKLFGLIAVLFLLGDAVFGYFLVKDYFYPYSLTTWSYLVQSSDSISLWTGRIAWIVFLVFYVCLPLVLGKQSRVTEPGRLVLQGVEWVKTHLAKMKYSLTLLGVDGGLLAVLLVLASVAPRPAPPPAGRLVLSYEPGSHKLFAVEPHNILVYNLNSNSGIDEAAENFPFPDPASMQYVSVSSDPRLLYASDYGQGLLHILDTSNPGGNQKQFFVGRTASGLAQSADGSKLYVGIIGPPPEGAIDVFRTDTLAQVDHIDHIGCPTGMSAATLAPILFVATQCGGGHDPLYVIDTRSDKVVDSFQGFAVGSSVVAAPDGRSAFVSTGDGLKILSGYGTPKQAISTFPGPISTLAVTSDGAILLVGTPPGIRAMDAVNLKWCGNDITLEAEPSAIAVGEDGTVVATLPQRMFITDIKAIECKTK